jgi:CheY-like chemotaxis protein
MDSQSDTPAGQRIVIVDDEPDVCAVVSEILAAAGYAAVATSDAREALALVRRERPALVLIDVGMPHIDGHQLASAIRDDPATRDAAVVFITGLISFSGRMKAFSTGARDYVTKPFTPERLLATVARALRAQAGGGGSSE